WGSTSPTSSSSVTAWTSTTITATSPTSLHSNARSTRGPDLSDEQHTTATSRDREGALGQRTHRSLMVAARQTPSRCIYHNAHDGAGAAAAEPIAAPPLATMLTRHIL